MKCLVIKTEKGLRGATQPDHDAWTKFRRNLEAMKPGTWIRMEWARPRNGRFHRKFFALLQLVANNSEVYDTAEKALVAVKLVTGHFDLMVHPETGEIVQIPRSISYDAMEQDEFDRFYSAAVDGVLQHILSHLDAEKMDRLLDLIIEGWA